MTPSFHKVEYSELNARQKENYNFHKIAAALAEYGYNSMRLSDDYHGADFISIHVETGEVLKIQQKSRWTVLGKYLGKGILIAFPHQKKVAFYDHDEVWNYIQDSDHPISKTKSFAIHKGYSAVNVPKGTDHLVKIIGTN